MARINPSRPAHPAGITKVNTPSASIRIGALGMLHVEAPDIKVSHSVRAVQAMERSSLTQRDGKQSITVALPQFNLPFEERLPISGSKPSKPPKVVIGDWVVRASSRATS